MTTEKTATPSDPLRGLRALITRWEMFDGKHPGEYLEGIPGHLHPFIICADELESELYAYESTLASHDAQIVADTLGAAAAVRIPNVQFGGTNGLDVAQQRAILALTPYSVAAHRASHNAALKEAWNEEFKHFVAEREAKVRIEEHLIACQWCRTGDPKFQYVCGRIAELRAASKQQELRARKG